MSNLKILFMLVFLLNVLSCSSKKTNYEETTQIINTEVNNILIGQITVVGNEPFTELGIIVNDTTIFVLECNEELKNSLLKNQGQNYKLIVKQNVESATNNKFTIINAEKVK